ncbi:MAG: hypothetical protein DWQ34_09625 [Planctomycetota bacterium]|nr:MAG: hypothetical protein DWQ29_07120 [Planctomycetota bacterium]REJ93918.1 MAG: hypothetical protein DWQ34_09625 [Planctomycetota bacterium]REK20676.1 MAG: hypothetical protein DWQ41_23800 [Planctomycetota bacterium]REK38142.1 MAG: hypothetical protein DWQ45_05750 [Planctomycetota bacterium]
MNCRHLFFAASCLIIAASTRTEAGWPFSADGPRKGSEEYYQMHACDPISARQKCKHGKLWPPYPRPMGEPAPCMHRFHASHYWPYPYNHYDRMSVLAVSHTQIGNGWQSACTFHHYHFDAVTHELNSAGRAHLQWMMANVPGQFRQAYLATTGDSAVNDLRLANFQETVAGYVGNADSLPVVLRVAQPVGRPADEVDSIFEQRLQNMDSPVIPFTSVISSGGGGSN